MATGIQLDGDWIGMVETRWVRGKAAVARVAQKHLSEDYGISEFFSEHKIPNGKFTISLPRHLATVKFLSLPSTNQVEIEEMVRFEAERLVPYSPEELLIDSRIITELENGYSRVMAVVVEKAVIEDYLSVLKGFTPESVSLTSIALYNWFMNTQEDKSGKTCALVNADFASADIVMVENGISTFTRGIALGKEGWAEKVVAETTRSLDAYTRVEKGNMPEIIVVTGVREDLAQLGTLMEEKVSQRVEVANAFTGIDVGPSNLDESYPAASSVIPVGLALQREVDESQINLLPDYIREKREASEKLRTHITTGILCMVVVLLSVFVVFHALKKRNSYLQQLVNENKKMQPLVSQIDSKRKQLDIIKQELNPGSECLEVLSEFHRIIPENIILNSLAIDVGEAVMLSGQANQLSEVFTLNTLLEESPLFENVKVKYANKRRISEDKEVTDFEIHCMIGG